MLSESKQQEYEAIKPDTGRQVLDINNAASEFIKQYSMRYGTIVYMEVPMNYTRYRLLRFKGEPCYVFFKFSRDPYFMAREGMSETVNIKDVKRLAMYFNEGLLVWMYFALNNGYIYRIKITDFLQKAYIETEERVESKTKYVISYKHMERWNV